MPLPRAILFDLDDTLISAYERPDVAWRAVIAEVGALLEPADPERALGAIEAYAREFWSDAARHQHWRQRLAESRRVIVAGAARALARDGHPPWSEQAGVRLADRFTAYRDERMALFPGAHRTLDALRSAGVRLALVTNGAAATQRLLDLARHAARRSSPGQPCAARPHHRATRTADRGLNRGTVAASRRHLNRARVADGLLVTGLPA